MFATVHARCKLYVLHTKMHRQHYNSVVSHIKNTTTQHLVPRPSRLGQEVTLLLPMAARILGAEHTHQLFSALRHDQLTLQGVADGCRSVSMDAQVLPVWE